MQCHPFKPSTMTNILQTIIFEKKDKIWLQAQCNSISYPIVKRSTDAASDRTHNCEWKLILTKLRRLSECVDLERGRKCKDDKEKPGVKQRRRVHTRLFLVKSYCCCRCTCVCACATRLVTGETPYERSSDWKKWLQESLKRACALPIHLTRCFVCLCDKFSSNYLIKNK